jgi:E3 ubiquitin-protein ligase SH3RF
VDENWAEGKLADRIGIFPLAFVELNQVARALMKLSTKYVYFSNGIINAHNGKT